MNIFKVLFKKNKITAKNVVFVEEVIKGKYTYFVYKAASKKDALVFLDTKTVSQPLHYIVVYTPEGNFGKDKDGGYEC